MRHRIEIHSLAAIVLAAVALTQFAACGTTPRSRPQLLSDWRSPEDCSTNYAAAVSNLPYDKGGATALLVDSIGSLWNCTTIPEGRYKAEIAVRWSNGWLETALDVKGIDVSPGQRLVAKAYERDRGAISASFSDVRVQRGTVQIPVGNDTPSSNPDPQMAPSTAREGAIPAAAREPGIPEVNAPSGQQHTGEVPAATLSNQAPPASEEPERTSFQLPSITKEDAGKLALSILTAPIWVPYAVGELSLIVAGLPFVPVVNAIENYRDERKREKEIAKTSRPGSDCCFVWIEDGVTGAVIAGSRPVQN